jgi:hypothetical protein
MEVGSEMERFLYQRAQGHYHTIRQLQVDLPFPTLPPPPHRGRVKRFLKIAKFFRKNQIRKQAGDTVL